MTVRDNDTDTWVSVSEAAELLGKSERTVWRWVKRGKLAIDRSVTPHLVNVTDNVTDTVVTPYDTVSQVSQAEVDELKAKVDRLASENERLQAANDRLRDVLDEVRDALQDARRERDDWKAAHAQSLRSLQTSQHLLEHVEEREDRPGWLERLLPWLGGRE